jgi:hypothetical protein
MSDAHYAEELTVMDLFVRCSGHPDAMDGVKMGERAAVALRTALADLSPHHRLQLLAFMICAELGVTGNDLRTVQ